MVTSPDNSSKTPNEDALLAKLDEYKLARIVLVNRLIAEGILKPNATDLPDEYLLPLLDQFGLRGFLSEKPSDKTKDIVKEE